ncbi:MAG: glycosyltransferase family 4 protein [Gemmatimonadaceae bacterium]|nr:glycosyltransferase family 4 protein [Gemmatimonadaceae bacterium]
MKVWLVTVGEPLPIDPGSPRLLRVGLLAEFLIAAGHEVTWWSSTFDHTHKRQRVTSNKRMRLPSGLRLHLLQGHGYQKNVSFARLRDHRALARVFAEAVRSEPRPDVILASFPPIELGYEAARFGRAAGIPVVLDVRDLWPDTFLYAVPRVLRRIARTVLRPAFSMTFHAFALATAVTGIAPPMVDWGLAKARRRRSSFDRDFPMGYPSLGANENAVEEGRKWWKETHGVVSGSGFTIVFFGSIGSTVDFEPVIDAARDLAASGVRFVLCGTGEELARLRARAEAMENVIIPGWVDAGRIASLLDIGDAGLAPYRNRPDYLTSYPNKVLEYLSGGLPVLSSIGGLIGDLLKTENCGIVYGETNTRLADAITQLQHDQARLHAMSSNARRVFSSRFSAEAVYPKMIDYLSTIVKAFGINPVQR